MTRCKNYYILDYFTSYFYKSLISSMFDITETVIEFQRKPTLFRALSSELSQWKSENKTSVSHLMT